MYKNFFGLRENPFNINPDPRFLHRTPRVQEALDQLTFGVQNRKGLLLLTGEVGTGKTMLVNHLLDWLRERHTPTAFIFNSHLQVNHLFDFILNDFGISADFHLVSNMLLELNQWLLKRFRAGSTPVLIIDEAQGLSLELLEEIRLLLNLETASEKLLQIVLVGQPELEEKLKQPEMRQLRQRIALRCNTAPLTLEESRGYIADRLRIAGATHEPIFESGAVEALHHYSRGVPRVMNLLCEHALINAYVDGLNPVPSRMVEEAARDFLMDDFRPLSPCHAMAMHMDSKLSIMHPELTAEPGRSFRDEPGSSLNAISIEMPAPAVGSTAENHLMAPGNSMSPAALVYAENVASQAHPAASLSVLDLLPAPVEFATHQFRGGLASNPNATQSDCAAELAATMGRLLVAASSVPGPHRQFSNLATENSPPLRCSPPRTRIAPASPAAIWSSVSEKTRQATRETMAAARVLLRQWKLDFTRDWNLTVNAMNSPQMKKSIVQWLRQPISSKSMASGKNQIV
jgi:general secretion pathway protein A